ncbi:MAG TPA: dihydroorotase [Stellaceae bacterium]|jgi:dihydroorotase|nr:dihydroorotase [Stellaceae bacterium]
MSTLFANARLLDPASNLDRKGEVLVDDGRIVAVGAGLERDGAEIVDCGGHCLAPGIVDMRVQLREPGDEHQETMATGGKAAAAGGITTMVALPNTDPVIDEQALVEFVARRSRDVGLTRIRTYAAATKGLRGKELTEMGLLTGAGALAFTDGVAAIADAVVMRRALSYATNFDMLIIQHPEESRLAEGGAMNSGEIATRLGLPGITPVAEVMMIERDLRLVEVTGARYHAAHVSTGKAIAAIRGAKQRGLQVTCDTAPPYFALNETAVGDYRTFAKVSPPLRSEDDRRAVVDGLRDGTIDAIASDHAPQDQESKRLPFASAASGIVGLETLLPLALELYHNGSVPLLRVLAALAQRPAEILRLPAGKLAAGLQADFVVFDLDRPWRIAVDAFLSKCRNSPFDGRPVQGRVLRTIVAGRTIHAAAGAA